MIVDSSVAVKWLVPEEGSEAAAQLVGQSDLIVPTLFHVEVANALWKKARRGELRLDEVAPHVAELPLLVTTVDESGLVARALAIAELIEHAVYDCIYLALAETRDEQVVTADGRFILKLAGTSWESRLTELGA